MTPGAVRLAGCSGNKYDDEIEIAFSLGRPHADVMSTERTHGGIMRDPAQCFRRWNANNLEIGDAGRDRYLASREFVRDVCEEWAITTNQFMAHVGIEDTSTIAVIRRSASNWSCR